jgi:hypothetical protein
LLLLLNNKDNKEELQTKQEDKKSHKKLNNMRLNTKHLKKLKLKPEEMPN